MLEKALFVYTTCLIVSWATASDEEVVASMERRMSLVWQTQSPVSLSNVSSNNSLIDDLKISLVHNFGQIDKQLLELPDSKAFVEPMSSQIYQVLKDVKTIDDRFDYFMSLIDPHNHPDNGTLAEFSKGVLDMNNGAREVCKNFQEKFIRNDKDGLIYQLNSFYDDIYSFCGTSKTKQRFFYDLFVATVTQYDKCYAMIFFSHSVYRDVLNYTDFSDRSNRLNRDVYNWFNQTLGLFKRIIVNSSRTMRRCDLQRNHTEGQTYTHLKDLFTRMFQYGTEIEKKHSTCDAECPSDSNILGVKCNSDCQIKQRKCNELVHCESATDHYLCLDRNHSQIRRYDQVENHYSKFQEIWSKVTSRSCTEEYFIGEAESCSKSNVCNCVCDESENSDRYFSLSDVTSNVTSNYVVTGVRFVKKNGIVKLQIQEGKLLPYGFIDQKTVNWTSTGQHEELEKYMPDVTNISEDNSNDNLNIHPDKMSANDNDLRNRQLLHNVTWSSRGIFLNNVESPMEHVLTGVRFSTDHIGEESFLKIEIQSTKYDFISGRLIKGFSFWNSSRVQDFKDNLIELDKYGVPTNASLLHEPETKTVKNKITRFTPTSLISKDTGSSVVPYLDIQPLFSQVAVPLSAMGLSLMRAENSGGYLVLTSKSLDVSQFL